MNEKPGSYRWVICSLIFFATTINYLDRAVISLLKSNLTADFKWDDGDYANSTFGFGVVRSALGLSEAGNFPSAIKTVAEWFPKKERALATGIFNSGANIGAIIAPLTVPFIVTQ